MKLEFQDFEKYFAGLFFEFLTKYRATEFSIT